MEEYANFCYKQYDFTEAEKYYQKCKELLTNKESCIKSSDLAFVYKNLGIIYDKNQQYKESETMFKEALKIYEHLANKTPGTYKMKLLWHRWILRIYIPQLNILKKVKYFSRKY